MGYMTPNAAGTPSDCCRISLQHAMEAAVAKDELIVWEGAYCHAPEEGDAYDMILLSHPYACARRVRGPAPADIAPKRVYEPIQAELRGGLQNG